MGLPHLAWDLNSSELISLLGFLPFSLAGIVTEDTNQGVVLELRGRFRIGLSPICDQDHTESLV